MQAARWFYCAAHADAALVRQAETVARAHAAGHATDGRPPAALACPFGLPPSLLRALDGHMPEPLVGLYWHGAGDVLAVYGTRYAFLDTPLTAHWWGFVEAPAVAAWLCEHMVDLGAPGSRANHHLVLDRARGVARVVRAPDARALVLRHAGMLGRAVR